MHIFLSCVHRCVQMRALDLLNLELQSVVSLHTWGLGPKLRFSGRTATILITEQSLQTMFKII